MTAFATRHAGHGMRGGEPEPRVDRCRADARVHARQPHLTGAPALHRVPALRPRPPQHGFTLIEMLAVIVLIGVTAGVMAMSISHGLGAARVRAASTDLAAALRYTRMQAIAHAQPQVLTVDVQARSYQEPGHAAHTLPPGMQVAITSARIEQQGTHTGAIRFFPDGSSTGGRVTLRRGNREWHVNVAWLTGAVSVVAVQVP